MSVKSHYFCGLILVNLLCVSVFQGAMAADKQIGPSGLPVPRFVHLKSSETWGRVGPSFDHPVRFELHQKNMPVRVIAETRDNNWRKIEDADGETMWIHRSQLISAPKALVLEPEGALLRAKPHASSPIRARIERGVIVTTEKCDGDWCTVSTGPFKGYIRQHFLWGVDT